MQPQRIKSGRVFGIVFTPARVRNFAESLRGIVRLATVTTAHDKASRMLRVGGAQIGGLEDRPQCPFGCDRMLPHEVPMCADHAAEVLRPRAVRGRAEQKIAVLGGARLFGAWREGVGGANPTFLW